MPDARLIHPDIYKRLGRITVFSAAVFLFVLAFSGLQECRGGRAILASDYGPQVYTKVELVGRERVLVWDGYLTFRPVRVFFSTDVGSGHFEVTVTDRDSGEMRTSYHGYVLGSGGAYYFLVTDKTALFAYSQPGYFRDNDTPGWIDYIFGTYYTVTDWVTCLV